LKEEIKMDGDSREKRQEAIANAMGVSPQNAVEPGEGGGEVDYYQNLKNESYKAMLDSEIQASVAKEQGLKYVNQGLNASGMAGQGMAESSRVGLLNAYQKAMGEAQATYNKDMTDIGVQEENAKMQEQKENFESLATLMNGASDISSLQEVMSAYGISVDKEGNLSGEGLNNLDDKSKKQLAALYKLYSSNYGDEPGVYTSIQKLQEASVAGSNGKPLKLGEQFNEETQLAFIHANQGELQPGAVVKLDNTNKKKDGAVAYIMWTGSGFKVVNEQAYNSASEKHAAIWVSGKESKWE